MAEAIGVSASVAGLIGLTGQIVQGCLFIKELFGDIKNAPDGIQSLLLEIEILSTSARTTESLIRQIGTSKPDFIGDEVEPALQQCSELVDKIKKKLDKNTGHITRQGKTKVWGSLRIAVGKKNIDSYLAHLERTRSRMMSVQQNISLSMHSDHRTNLLNMDSAIQQLSESGRAHIAMTEKLNANISLVKDNHSDLNGRLQNLEMSLVDMPPQKELSNIEGLLNYTIARALSQHQNLFPVVGDNRHTTNIINSNFGVIDNNNHITHSPRVLQPRLVSKAITDRRRRANLFQSYHQIFFFNIYIKTIERVQGSEPSDSYYKERCLETSIEVRTKVPSWKRRFVIDVVKPLVKSATSVGMTICTHNTISKDAPVWDACLTFDLDEMRQLFNLGLASPYDQDTLGWTLLDYLLYLHFEEGEMNATERNNSANWVVETIQYLNHSGYTLPFQNSILYLLLCQRTTSLLPSEIQILRLVAHKMFDILIEWSDGWSIMSYFMNFDNKILQTLCHILPAEDLWLLNIDRPKRVESQNNSSKDQDPLDLIDLPHFLNLFRPLSGTTFEEPNLSPSSSMLQSQSQDSLYTEFGLSLNKRVLSTFGDKPSNYESSHSQPRRSESGQVSMPISLQHSDQGCLFQEKQGVESKVGCLDSYAAGMENKLPRAQDIVEEPGQPEMLQPSLFKRGKNAIRKLLRPKPQANQQRIEWICGCGDQLYADISNMFPEELNRLSAIFQCPPYPSTGASAAANITRNLSQTSAAAPTYLPRGLSSVSSQSSTRSPLATLVGSSHINSSPQAPIKTYLELCINSSEHTKVLREINLDGVGCDGELFKRIRNEYLSHRGVRSQLRLLKPVGVHFVKFAVQDSRRVGILRKPLEVPPVAEVVANNYSYIPCPLQGDPPIPENVFLHYLTCTFFEPTPAWLPRIPKKLNTSILRFTGAINEGWGTHIIEGPNWYVLAVLNLALMITSGVIALLWTILKHDFQGAFGFAGWIVASVALGNSVFAVYATS